MVSLFFQRVDFPCEMEERATSLCEARPAVPVDEGLSFVAG